MAGVILGIGLGAIGLFEIHSAQQQRKAEEKAIEKLRVAHEAVIDVAAAHTETTATEMRGTAVETIAASRGQIEAQMAFMGGRGARSGAAFEAALSKAETGWLEQIDTETQFILDDLEAKREIVGAQASLADISSRIAFTQSIFGAFESMITPLLDVRIQPGARPGTGAASMAAGAGSAAYKPPRYGG